MGYHRGRCTYFSGRSTLNKRRDSCYGRHLDGRPLTDQWKFSLGEVERAAESAECPAIFSTGNDAEPYSLGSPTDLFYVIIATVLIAAGDWQARVSQLRASINAILLQIRPFSLNTVLHHSILANTLSASKKDSFTLSLFVRDNPDAIISVRSVLPAHRRPSRPLVRFQRIMRALFILLCRKPTHST